MEIKSETIIRTKGFDISIGKKVTQIALFSQSNSNPTPFSAIRKKGRLAKIKGKFQRKLCSDSHFFFEGMNESDIMELVKILK